MKLEHLAPYLPYNIRMIFEKSGREIYLSGLSINENGNMILIDYSVGEQFLYKHWNFKPVLRPLSDLTKEIEHNGDKFAPWFEIMERAPFNCMGGDDIVEWITETSTHRLNYNEAQIIISSLIEWHFDVFGLIDQGLAIDKNTLT